MAMKKIIKIGLGFEKKQEERGLGLGFLLRRAIIFGMERAQKPRSLKRDSTRRKKDRDGSMQKREMPMKIF